MMQMRNDRFGWSAVDPGDGLGPRLQVDDGADIHAIVASLEEQARVDDDIAKYAGTNAEQTRMFRDWARTSKALLHQAKQLAAQGGPRTTAFGAMIDGSAPMFGSSTSGAGSQLAGILRELLKT